jgi:hypothetical protein
MWFQAWLCPVIKRSFGTQSSWQHWALKYRCFDGLCSHKGAKVLLPMSFRTLQDSHFGQTQKTSVREGIFRQTSAEAGHWRYQFGCFARFHWDLNLCLGLMKWKKSSNMRRLFKTEPAIAHQRVPEPWSSTAYPVGQRHGSAHSFTLQCSVGVLAFHFKRFERCLMLPEISQQPRSWTVAAVWRRHLGRFPRLSRSLSWTWQPQKMNLFD